MELTTVAFGLLVAAICIVPFVLISRNKRRKEKTFIDLITSLAAKSNGKIDEYDRWNTTIIGIDHSGFNLFFCRTGAPAELQKAIPLSDVLSCNVESEKRTIKAENYDVIEKIGLRIAFRDARTSATLLPFYDAGYDSLTVVEELNLAEKWSKKINGVLDRAKS
jgi:hypothetical protein